MEKIKNTLKELLIKNSGYSEKDINDLIGRMNITIAPAENNDVNTMDAEILKTLNKELNAFVKSENLEDLTKKLNGVVEVRPTELPCDVVRFQNNKEKWVALVGLLDGRPYEIFTGLQDEDDGIMLPKAVTTGRIIKRVNPDGSKRYDFQFENRRGYKTTVEGLSEKFNPEYWNYAKLISGVLRYRMPIENVIKLVGQMQMKSESINTWINGVERALKKYIPGAEE